MTTSQEPVDKGQEQKQIITAGHGKAFKTASAARLHAANLGLTKDDYTVVPYIDGFGIKPNTMEMPDVAPAEDFRPESAARQASEDNADEKRPVAPRKEKCFWVKFAAKSDKNQDDRVVLGVNGDLITCAREEEVCLPERFLEVADHALTPHFKDYPGEGRKADAWIKTFPYDRLREGTWAEYEKQRKSGTVATKKSVDITQAPKAA